MQVGNRASLAARGACSLSQAFPRYFGNHHAAPLPMAQPARRVASQRFLPTSTAECSASYSCPSECQASCSDAASPVDNRSRFHATQPAVSRAMAAAAPAWRFLGSCRAALQRQQPSILMCAVAAVPSVTPGTMLQQLQSNYVFVVGFWAWAAAQFMKIFTKRVKEGIWDVTAVIDSGGMPSSHSALCMAVTTATAHKLGLGSPIFAVALAFSLVVMYDAANVRWHAGKQAEVLNVVMADLLEGHPISDKKMKEVLGHTPVQVMAGAILGLLVGLFYPTPITAFT